MILGYNEDQIVKMAVSCQSEMTDGVVQYNYKTGKLCGASFTTGETENPANPVIEVFWLKQGERGKIDCDCDDCPYRSEDARYEGWEKLYPETRNECCVDAYIDNDFDDDFENNFREHVESQIKDVLSDYLGETIEKLNDVRLALLDITEPHRYVENRVEDWCYNVLDVYVDYAMDDGFTIAGDPQGYLESEVIQIENIALYGLNYGPVPNAQKIVERIRSGDLDGALEMLQ